LSIARSLTTSHSGGRDRPPVERAALELVAGPPDEVEEIVVSLQDCARRAGDDCADDGGVEKPPQAFIALPQCLLATAQLADVAGDDHEALQRAINGAAGRHSDLDSANRPVGEAPVCLAQPRPPRASDFDEGRDRTRIHLAVHRLEHAPP